MIRIIYSDNFLTKAIEAKAVKASQKIFLAGPSPRGDKDQSINWRLEAIEFFNQWAEDRAYNDTYADITIFIPLPESGVVDDYDAQIEWEQTYLAMSDVVLFWVPRDLEKLPAFTTNVEFGQYVTKKSTVYGRPDSAPKNRYLDNLFLMQGIKGRVIYKSLYSTLMDAISKLNLDRTPEPDFYPKTDRLYRHYKGGTYKVLGMSKHTETGEPTVIYVSLEFGSLHPRPLRVWNEMVMLPDGSYIPRFQLITDESYERY